MNRDDIGSDFERFKKECVNGYVVVVTGSELPEYLARLVDDGLVAKTSLFHRQGADCYVLTHEGRRIA